MMEKLKGRKFIWKPFNKQDVVESVYTCYELDESRQYVPVTKIRGEKKVHYNLDEIEFIEDDGE